jgi:osmotically-inducible protein OsmY
MFSSTAIRGHFKARGQGCGLPHPPKPGHRSIVENTMSSDNDLKKAVLDELSWEPSVNAAHIGVTAHNGVITLTGHVENYMHKMGAEKAAGRVKGVKAVAEEIEVKLPFDIKRSDEDIAAAALNRLGWNSMLPEEEVKVKVQKGWVTLTGNVDWHFEKEAAERDVRALSGVIGVSNQLVVKPTVSASNVKKDIEHALHRSWFFDPDTIQVATQGGKITLSGKVSTWTARQMAGATAWSAPGATSVENDITVNY